MKSPGCYPAHEADRIHDGAGENVSADFRAFLEDDDGYVRIEFLQPDRGGETCRSGADDDDVELHPLARTRLLG